MFLFGRGPALKRENAEGFPFIVKVSGTIMLI